MEQQQAKIAEMRDFSWEHWVHRKPAKLVLTAVGKAGASANVEVTANRQETEFSSKESA